MTDRDLAVGEADPDRGPTRHHRVRSLPGDDPIEIGRELRAHRSVIGICRNSNASISHGSSDRVFHAELSFVAITRGVAHERRYHAIARLDIDTLDIVEVELALYRVEERALGASPAEARPAPNVATFTT